MAWLREISGFSSNFPSLLFLLAYFPGLLAAPSPHLTSLQASWSFPLLRSMPCFLVCLSGAPDRKQISHHSSNALPRLFVGVCLSNASELNI